MKSKSLLLFILGLFLLSSCHKNEEEELVPVVKAKTVIVYIAGENSLNNYVSYDLREMKDAAAQVPLDCNYVIYVDNTGMPIIYTLNAQQGLVTAETLTERNSCELYQFRDNLHYIITKYPAEQYGLVMWSHGSGWIPQARKSAPHRTIGIDNNVNSPTLNIGTELEIADMRNAIEQLGIHFRYILFDACFMQCVESDYELRNVADYIIASSAEIPGDGAPYNRIMKGLTDMTESGVIDIVENYYQNYEKNDGVVISAVKTSELEPLLNITRKLCPDFYTMAYDFDASKVQSYCSFTYQTIWKPEYYDFGSTMSRMLSLSDYNEWMQQAQKTMLLHHETPSWLTSYRNYFLPYMTDAEHAIGLSIFIPNKKYDKNTDYNKAIKQTQWYKDYMIAPEF